MNELATVRLLAPAGEAWVALAGAAVVLAVAAALERRRPAPGRRGRLLALALALGALVLLVARPAVPTAAGEVEVVLLTPGASPADLTAAGRRGLLTWSLAGRAGEPRPPLAATPLPDAATLSRRAPGLRRVRVHGHGLTAAEWATLPATVIVAKPPPLPFGVATLSWPRRLPLGAELRLGGRVAGVPEGGALVKLSGPGIAPVQARLGPREGRFSLATRPRGPGRQLLTLSLEAAGRPAVVERLELEVVAATPPAVLWLEDAPSLEGREVARWLHRAAVAVAVRSRLASGIARELQLGGDAVSLAPLTTPLLRGFDLVVLDGGSWATLPPSQRATLRTAVERDGLGVLLRPEERSAPTIELLGGAFRLRSTAGDGRLLARLVWPGAPAAPPIALPPRELVPEGALVPLAGDGSGRLLAAWRPAGAGTVGVSLLDGTWRWVREGSAASFHRYWGEVISTLARPAPAVDRWSVAAGPALVGRPLTVVVETTAAAPVAGITATDGSVTRPGLRQDPEEARRWSTTFWPRLAGWHRLGDGAGALWVWVAPAERWLALRLAERQEATAARASATGPPEPALAANEGARVLRQLPRWPSFLVLLGALAWLWGGELFVRRRGTVSPGGPAGAAADRLSRPPG